MKQEQRQIHLLNKKNWKAWDVLIVHTMIAFFCIYLHEGEHVCMNRMCIPTPEGPSSRQVPRNDVHALSDRLHWNLCSL